MAGPIMTAEQIRRAGLEALLRELGPEGMVRFLQQFETGAGDYTQDRDARLETLSVDQVVDEIIARRRAQGSASP